MSINVNALENVILFGDSLMAGYGLPQKKHLAIVLQNNLNDSGYNIGIIDGSVSGSTSAGGLNRVEWSLSQPNIDLMILGLGANDMLRGISPIETEKNLENQSKVKEELQGFEKDQEELIEKRKQYPCGKTKDKF